MTKPVTIPMTGAAAIGPIPRILADRESDRAVDKVFTAASIPLSAMMSPRSPIPLIGLAQLWENGARVTGDRCFGFSGGFEMTHATYGLWLEYCISASTLGEALARIPKSLRFHQTGTRFSFSQEKDVAVLRYHPAWPGQFQQHSDHVVGSAVRLIRSYLGESWYPPWVDLDYERDQHSHTLEDILAVPLRFGSGTTGVAVAIEDLQQPSLHRITRNLTIGDIAVEATFATTAEPFRTIFNVANYRLLEGQVDIGGAAELCGVGVQTLQRRLRLAGLTYRDVLAQARCQRAKALLLETQLPVAEIAYSLGYEDHANFTHAFTKWTGQSPSRVRQGSD